MNQHLFNGIVRRPAKRPTTFVGLALLYICIGKQAKSPNNVTPNKMLGKMFDRKQNV